MSYKNERSTSADIVALRYDVSNEIAVEEENLSLIDRHNGRAKRLIPLLIGVLVINAILFFLLPHYPIYWIISSLLLYMLYFVVLLVPTTRRLRTPADKKKCLKARPRPKMRGIGRVVLRGKKAVAVAFWNTFFIGTQTMARGVSSILLVSVTFALLAFAAGTLGLFSTAVITAQALAIMGYYYIIVRYRPYSKGFLRMVSRLRRDKRTEFRWQAYLKGILLVLVMLTVLAAFVVSAVLLPGQSLQAVLGDIGVGTPPVLIGLVVVFASQFIIVRYIQGFDSAKVSANFIRAKLSFLRNDVLLGIEEAERSDGPGLTARLRQLQMRFRASRIYKVAYKDIFGILPTYPLIVDFMSVLEEEVAEALQEEIPLDIPLGVGAGKGA